jgi:hypothetical protein
MGKEKFIQILAIIIIIIGGISTAYVYATQIDKDTITLNGQEFTIDQIFYLGETRIIQTIEGEKTGVALDDLITKIGVDCPACHEYTIKAKDGYEKTVNWDIMKTGILTDSKRIFFPDTAKAYWVRDVVVIEVE